MAIMEHKTNTDSAASAAPTDISLIRGGPFYRAQMAIRLIDPDHWNVGRRILFAIAVGWLPIMLIRAVLDPSRIMQLLTDYRIAARMLIALPVLFLAQPFMEARFRMLVRHIRDAHLLEGPDLARMDEIITRVHRLGNSVWPELVILLGIVVRTAISYKFVGLEVIGDLSVQTAAGPRLTTAGWYAMLVSAPLLQFLLFLCLWKWLLWAIFIFKLSRLNLRLVPSHPDENGGLGFLSLSPQAFAPIAFASTIIIGASFRNRILNEGAHLTDFKLSGIAFVVIIFLVALAPLIFFVPRLAALRRKGILEYSIVGHMQSTAFHEKWVVHGAEHEAGVIDAPEMSTLCDYNSAFHNVEQLKPFPIDKATLIGLALSVAIPALPTILAEVPVSVVLEDLLSALK